MDVANKLIGHCKIGTIGEDDPAIISTVDYSGEASHVAGMFALLIQTTIIITILHRTY